MLLLLLQLVQVSHGPAEVGELGPEVGRRSRENPGQSPAQRLVAAAVIVLGGGGGGGVMMGGASVRGGGVAHRIWRRKRGSFTTMLTGSENYII